MTKAIGAAWQSDLAASKSGGVLSLAFCWEIERTDGTFFRFTDHDRPLLFDGETYSTTAGFDRSALRASGDLAPESTSIVGIFDTGAIEKEDLLKGLFDGAKVKIFIVDFLDLTKPAIKAGYGRFGEVSGATRNLFRVEFRDLSQLLNEERGELRQPSCRANLGDAKCNNAHADLPGAERNPVPIEVPVRLDLTAYNVGDVVKVSTGTDPASFETAIANPDFETGTTSGWTVLAGGFQVLATHAGMSPHKGSYLLRAGPSDPAELSQIIDFRTISGFSQANVDAGLVDIRFSIFRATADQTIDDAGRVLVYDVDSALADLGAAIYDSGDEVISPLDAWVERTSGATLSATAAGVRVLLRGPAVSGDQDALFDNISLVMVDRGQTAGSSFAYEDRVYRCTTAGTSAASPPTMNETIGGTTTDGGTLVWTAELAYAIAGEVRDVTDNANFSARYSEFTDPLYVAPWFNLGAVVWETGANAGFVSEIKIVSPPAFELKWPAPLGISPGDKFRAWPGCDKQIATCVAKFDQTPPTTAGGNKDNFRGEPHLPGEHAFVQTPDAKV